MLPWLQRAYLQQVFADFDPTSGRDDDTPYDVDHMIPQSDWGAGWTNLHPRLTVSKELSNDDINRIRWERWNVGNAIGNKWLVDFSVNRGWGNCDICNQA